MPLTEQKSPTCGGDAGHRGPGNGGRGSAHDPSTQNPEQHMSLVEHAQWPGSQLVGAGALVVASTARTALSSAPPHPVGAQGRRATDATAVPAIHSRNVLTRLS